MKKIFGILAILSLVLIPVSVQAKVIKDAPDSYVIAEDETINDDLFVSSSQIKIEGVVNGDVYAIGERISIRGVVNGDVFLVGSKIEITGNVLDDANLIGETISIQQASIGDSLRIFGSTANIGSEATVGGGFLGFGQSIDLKSSVARGVMAFGESILLDGSIGKDVVVYGTNITLDDNTDIAGDITYYSDEEISKSSGANVAGETNQKQSEQKNTPLATLIGARIAANVYGFAAALVVGALILAMKKDAFAKTTKQALKQPLGTLLIGLAFLLATLPAAVFVIVTIIGAPLGLIMITLWLIALYVASIIGAFVIEREFINRYLQPKTQKKLQNKYTVLAIALAGYYLLRIIPVVGGLVHSVALIVGFGIIGREITSHINAK